LTSEPSPQTGDAEELRDDRSVGSVDLTHWSTPAGRSLAASAGTLSGRVGSRGALILTLSIGIVVAFLLGLAASRIYDSIARSSGIAGLDRPILREAMRVRSPVLDAVATGYTDLAGPIAMPIIAIMAILVLSLRRRSWTPLILIAAGGAGSLSMTIAGKDVIGRVRPPHADAVPPFEYSPSFPSGHTLNAVVIVGVIAYLLLLRRRTAPARIAIVVAAVLFALTIGASRVLLGHHWFTDVLAGWALGAAWLAILITAHRLYITTRARHESTEPEDDDDRS
jgi:undecaprenyl-diphosphatase